MASFSLAARPCSAWSGSVVLSYLTREMRKFSRRKSATGILYVDFFTVIVGEVLAKYVLLSTKVPVGCGLSPTARNAMRGCP